jgi:hypothetical protein
VAPVSQADGYQACCKLFLDLDLRCLVSSRGVLRHGEVDDRYVVDTGMGNEEKEENKMGGRECERYSVISDDRERD